MYRSLLVNWNEAAAVAVDAALLLIFLADSLLFDTAFEMLVGDFLFEITGLKTSVDDEDDEGLLACC